jgi:hypothetical protein
MIAQGLATSKVCVETFHRILLENTAGLRVTATKLIFISQNKEQSHRPRIFDATELQSV